MRKLAVEAADKGLLAPELASGIARIKGVKSHGVRVGNWLSLGQAQALLNAPRRADEEGTARPGHVRHPARLRTASVGSSEPDH